MTFAQNLQIALASTLLLTVVSCGNDSKSKSAPQKQEDQIVQSYDWKFVSAKGFPAQGHAYVDIKINGEHEILINECNAKNINSIDRSSSPEVLKVANFMSPGSAEMVEVTVADCASDSNAQSVTETVRLEVNKSGAVAEVIVNL